MMLTNLIYELRFFRITTFSYYKGNSLFFYSIFSNSKDGQAIRMMQKNIGSCVDFCALCQRFIR